MAKVLVADEIMILEVIGDFILKIEQQSLGVTNDEPSQEERRLKGESWFEVNRQKLKEAVCENEKLLVAISKVGSDDQVSLGLLIADAITSITIGVPPVFIAALIVKIGVNSLCNGNGANA